jgi:hypothetical protein
MKDFDKHHIQCEIRCDDGMSGWAACTDGKIAPLWKRMQDMAAGEKGRKIAGWTFWVMVRRGPIEITANGTDITYGEVFKRAERILYAAEYAFEHEHGEAANAAA